MLATAIECPITTGPLTFGLRDDHPITTQNATTKHAWLTLGFDEDPDRTVIVAPDAILGIMGGEDGLSRYQALAISSVTVDFRITLSVNGVRGLHAVFQEDPIRWE